MVSHREMRNNSGEILRRVEAGESIEVSNNGRRVAVIVPAVGGVLEGMIARGEARPALTDVSSLAAVKRVASNRSTRDIIDESRGHW